MPGPITPPVTDATAPQGFFVSAAQAPEIAARQRELNRAKKPAFIPDAIKRESKRSQLYIFNVGPKIQEGCGASYGRVMIQPCPEGKEYGDPFIVPGLPHEYYNKEGSTLDVQFHGDGDIEDPGWDWACQAIGGYTDEKGNWEGKFLAKGNSLEKFGVGISRTWPPSKKDVELAKKKLFAEYRVLVQAAREAHAVGKLSQVVQDQHFVAAHALGLTAESGERWLEFSAPARTEEKPKCPKCRNAYEPGTVEHECGFILDKKQYDLWVKEGLIANAK